MKHPLLLPLLLLGTVAAFHLENRAPHLDSRETQADLSQGLEGSGDQEGELALTEEEIQSKEAQVEASSYQNDFEEEKAVKLDPSALDNNLQCPRTEDTVEIVGSPGCKTCRYILVRTPQAFTYAQNTCRGCYRGNLVSVHNLGINYHLQCMTGALNLGQVWIGGFIWGWYHCWKFFWSDGSCWNYANWAAGQPNCGVGHCVTLCTRGGQWRRAPCLTALPFICSV
ncbi:proteoglycan 3-like [Desmodus rotundus]|uniref:proteoglycan 3-like n=1 Tax=Desmodus rotundus TaxID=9430 RepID=UPI002380D202|nr:proteoglycan 3-like [Desmodus rotundus]XP_053780831.1 proteoglycan 3-like [Desmodus rotundus]